MADNIPVIEKAKQHFLDKLQGEMKSVEVPEWDVTVYFKPLTLTQQDRIYKYLRQGSLEALAETLIVRALHEDGSKMFKAVNKTEFMSMVDPGVVNKIVLAMAEDEDDLEDLEGN